MKAIALLAAGVSYAAAFGAAAADDTAGLYRGRTITLMSSAGAGGGYDAYARALARHIVRHLTGAPTILVQNKPGAGGLVLANYLYNVAAKDGSIIGSIHRNIPTDPLLGRTSGKYDPVKFNWLGSVTNEVSVCAAWHTAPVRTIQDAMIRELIIGGQSNTDTETFPIVLNNLIGTKFRIIGGYASGTQANLAIERGELSGRCGWSWSSVKSERMQWVTAHAINLLLQISLEKDPELPDVPLVMDFVKSDGDRQALKLILSRQVFGRPFVAPPGVAKARVALLRQAFMDTMRDPAFIHEIDRQKLELNPVPGDEMQALIEDLYRTPKAIVQRAIDATRPKKRIERVVQRDVVMEGKVTRIVGGGREIVFADGGKELRAKISSSRTAIMVRGGQAERKDIRLGMSCRIIAPGPEQEARRLECR